MQTILGSLVGIWVADRWIAGFGVPGDWLDLVIAGVVLGLVILIIGGLIKTLTFPISWLTLGVWKLIINGFLIWLLADLTSYASVVGLKPLILATLVISLGIFVFKGFKL